MEQYRPIRENYGNCCVSQPRSFVSSQATPVRSLDDVSWIESSAKGITMNTDIPLPFCRDQKSLGTNLPGFMSSNQKLAAGSNPKTKIAPVIVARSHDLDHWRANDAITHSSTNNTNQQDAYLSGYAISNCCGDLENKLVIQNNGCSMGMVGPKPAPKPVPHPHPIKEEYALPEWTPGDVNTACGYNPEQVAVGLPSNLEVGECNRNENMKQFNQNLYTQTIQPNVYSRQQVNETINANIGISVQQQFEPTTCQRGEDGSVMYTLHDPSTVEPENPAEPDNRPTQSNVYDPRFNGYGTSYRSYTEPVTGQTRYMYDDVDAIRRPNYIVRSNIDHLAFADRYGPMQNGQEFGNPNTSIVHGLANDGFLRNSLQFRNDMTERLMRKRNAELWQMRKYPKNTHGGGCVRTGGTV